ncbi:glutamate-1-semialdehyde 2,1-aminomutase [Anaerosporobacter faecicola]|uniref:glutamate-1-semialdehyde 2,1-aminomutase n=1 Tax=Anaerosporobacter faecicola TaxID=2718714 RepID=UPI001438C91C|nr:glutamate-1-semialdehyde 2,1-aminomutase [Anaerosporobacter faecicola]
MNTTRSEQLFAKAVDVIPGGVNSPVRAFQAVGGSPRFIEKAKQQYLYDVDGNRYIDYIGSWGPMILGHQNEQVQEAVQKAIENGLSFGAATEIEVEMAQLICELVPSIDMIRMVNSGTEAVMSAIRVARGFTKRNKVIKFAGCYHGHADAMLVKAGSGVMTSGVPDSAGVPIGCAEDTLTAIYNDLMSVETLMQEHKGEVACVIVEPVAANMGVVLPKEGFLQGLREICTKEGCLLIFDEVITGFRLGIAGASGYFGIQPDLITYGKIIGGGMPVGAYGGRKEIMKIVSPVGTVYQAGTLSGNPVAMHAGITQLRILRERPEVYRKLDELGEQLRNGLQDLIETYKIPAVVNGVGSLSCLFFTKQPVMDYETAKRSDTALFAKYFTHMLNKGHYIGPSQFEAIFLSAAHTEENVQTFLSDAKDFFISISNEV